MAGGREIPTPMLTSANPVLEKLVSTKKTITAANIAFFI
jgi:hypothetical protein